MENPKIPSNKVEIRGFGSLMEIFKRNNWPVPLEFDLSEECLASELAIKVGLPIDTIEAVFINHKVVSLEVGLVKPGDRVSFIPQGVPGPYRVLLGITKLPEHNEQDDGVI